MKTPTTMLERVNAYLSERRHAGFALKIEGEQLTRFAHFADSRVHPRTLTVKLAVQWATSSRLQKRLTAARRIEILRPFARYCQQFEPATEIPHGKIFGPSHRRLQPHIFTCAEIQALLAACADLHPLGGLRGTTCAAIFGLIAATGLRISEATRLQHTDVDLERGLLLIQCAKYGKIRWVPVHLTTKQTLQHYAQQRDSDPLRKNTDAFFVFDYGRPASAESLRYAFKLLRQQLGWHARGGHPAPRIHDMRHTFICRRLESGYTQGLDIDRHILALSTYVVAARKPINHLKISEFFHILNNEVLGFIRRLIVDLIMVAVYMCLT